MTSSARAHSSPEIPALESALHAGADHVTPYDRLVWDDEQVEQLLAAGEQREELETFFGPLEYRALVRLARAARERGPPTDSHPTIIVPGIMGTQLGIARHAPLPRDILWLDPVDISCGRLTELTLPGTARVSSQGIVLYTYLRLRLHLRAAGARPVFHPYDWRRGVDVLGRELAERLRSDPTPRIALIGHSMGGLVCRAALACPGGDKVQRVVLLGTPHFGSFAPVQALRGCCSVVRRIARLDPQHTPEHLAAQVFNTFPSLYHMLPAAGVSGRLDLFDIRSWPTSGPRPLPELLDAGRAIHGALAPPDARMVNVIGVGKETVTAIAKRGDQFVYTITRHGDSTVPVACAHLPGAHNVHAAVEHSELARDSTVAAAVIELLRSGSTRRLAAQWQTASRAEARISERALRRSSGEKVDWARLTPAERRSFLQNLNEPLKLRLAIPARARKRRPRRRAFRPGPRRAGKR